jgi:cyclase
MKAARLIPVLLLSNSGCVKSTRFQKHRYIGDPINTLRILCEKEADEAIVLDIEATTQGLGPNFQRAKELSEECFMPLGYGGGISNLEEVRKLLHCGIEKVVLNSATFTDPELISKAAEIAGSQSVVVCIDAKRSWAGYHRAYSSAGRVPTKWDAVEWARNVETLGAGEIILQSIDNDGTGKGYDLDLIEKVARAVNIPVVALGGAATLDDASEAIRCGASAAAAGSMFVFHGSRKAVLITYPTRAEIERSLTQ